MNQLDPVSVSVVIAGVLFGPTMAALLGLSEQDLDALFTYAAEVQV